jgi:RNA polymerase sigma factor (sigma-70 family)
MPPPAEGLASRLFLGPALRTQPDRRLVTLVREGYEAAFEEIVRRYGRPLSGYAASIVGGRSEDVTQDAFSKALLALRRDDAEIELRPWLYRIVRNTALNDLRDSPPSAEVLAEAIAGGRNPAEELERREELADLMKRLRALPEPQRAAIVMRELEGLGHEEIAAALGLSGGGARQAIYRARRALRDAAGLLLPLPLLRLLIDHGAEAAGAGGAAGGAIVAASASAGGAGGAAKLGVVAVVLAGSVGAGVAVQDRRGDEPVRDRAQAARSDGAPVPASPLPSVPRLASVDPGDEAGSAARSDGGSSGPDRGGEGDDGSGRGHDDQGERGGGDDLDDDRRGEHGRSGRGSSHHGGRRHGDAPTGHGGPDGDDHRGHGDGHGSGGHSGPGRGDDLVGDGGHGGAGSSGPGGAGGELRTGSDSGSGGHSGPGGGGQAPPPPPPEAEGSEESRDSGGGGASGSNSDRSGSGDGGG